MSDQERTSGGEPEEQSAPEPAPYEPPPDAVAAGPAESEGDEAEPAGDSAPPDEAESEAQFAAAQLAADEAVREDSRRHTRRAFVVAAAGVAAGYGFYQWIANSPRDEAQPWPLRKAFRTNAAIARGVTEDRALAPVYPLKDARDLRVNGVYGLKQMLVPESWRLQVVGSALGAGHARYSSDVTAWEYSYTDMQSHEDQGHDTKVDPNAKTAEKMAPAAMMKLAMAQQERAGRRWSW